MPARSAPMLMVLARKSASAASRSTGRGSFIANAPTRPRPVCMPTRAHIICTACMSGQLTHENHSSELPSRAPAMEKVTMPEGSSSAAPEMMPGPRRGRWRTNAECRMPNAECLCARILHSAFSILHFAHVRLQLARPMRRRVLAQHALACALADGAALVLRRVVQNLEHLLGAARDQNFFSLAEQRRQARPFIADDRHGARGGLEEAHARRPAGAHHLGARDVEGEALRVVELPVLARREVVDAPDFARPADGVGVLRASKRRTLGDQPARTISARVTLRAKRCEL